MYLKSIVGYRFPVKIEISARLLTNCDIQDIKNTICYELLHTAFPYDGHKGQWLLYARKMNEIYPQYQIKRTYSPNSLIDEDFKYHITCLNCGKVFKYKSASKVVKIVEGKQKGSLICPVCHMQNNLKIIDE